MVKLIGSAAAGIGMCVLYVGSFLFHIALVIFFNAIWMYPTYKFGAYLWDKVTDKPAHELYVDAPKNYWLELKSRLQKEPEKTMRLLDKMFLGFNQQSRDKSPYTVKSQELFMNCIRDEMIYFLQQPDEVIVETTEVMTNEDMGLEFAAYCMHNLKERRSS